MKTIKTFELKIKRISVSEENKPYGQTIGAPEQAASIAKQLIGNDVRECILAFFLDRQNRIIGCHEVSKGNMDSCSLDPRHLFRVALEVGTIGMILAHNHPSGVCEPSRIDIKLTEKIASACTLLGIELLDHVIVSDSSHYSMREHNTL